MSRRVRSVVVLLAVLALLPVPRAAPAQRYSVGGAVILGQPLGDFAKNVSNGVGLDGMGTLSLDPRGIASLRAQIGYLQYSRKTEPFYVTSGLGYYELESETKSGVLMLGIGPQLMVPDGPIRPYVSGMIGFTRFATQTAINIPARASSTGSTETLDQRTVSSDFIVSLAGAGGFAFKLSLFGASGAMADVGVRYHRNGQAKYVSPAGVQYDGNGTATITPTTSEADFIVYRLGVVLPIR